MLLVTVSHVCMITLSRWSLENCVRCTLWERLLFPQLEEVASSWDIKQLTACKWKNSGQKNVPVSYSVLVIFLPHYKLVSTQRMLVNHLSQILEDKVCLKIFFHNHTNWPLQRDWRSNYTLTYYWLHIQILGFTTLFLNCSGGNSPSNVFGFRSVHPFPQLQFLTILAALKALPL